MLTGLDWLALEVRSLDRARAFYETHLGVDARTRSNGAEAVFAAGDTDVLLREPSGVPRGGLHVHYAFATPPACYDAWDDRLSDAFDPVEVDFGGATSLYVFDPDGHCVEIGQREGTGDDSATDDRGEASTPPLTGVFEVVLEVESLARAEAFYRDLGFAVVDRGDDRPRVRLEGPVDLELWEPHLGLADARGGVHVDLGFATPDPVEAADAVADRARDVESLESGDRTVRIRDPDGHSLTFRAAE